VCITSCASTLSTSGEQETHLQTKKHALTLKPSGKQLDMINMQRFQSVSDEDNHIAELKVNIRPQG